MSNLFVDPVKVDLHQDKPNAPESQNEISQILFVKNFVRPFKLTDAQDLLKNFGSLNSFWMDSCKRVCIAEFSSKSESNLAREGLYNLVWPIGGQKLDAEFIDECESEQIKARNGQEPYKKLILLDEIESDNYVSKFEAKFKNEESRKKNDSEIKNKSKVIETNKLVSLDTIFKKTKTKPCLYYLPLTDEEINQKKQREIKD